MRIIHAVERWRSTIGLALAVLGSIIAIWAWVVARDAQSENRTDIRNTAAAVLLSCQTANKTRPQIERNALVGIDAALARLHAPVKIRRDLARAQVSRLSDEMRIGGSIGFRDCNSNGRIDRGDFLPDQPPPPHTRDGRPRLLGPDGLPQVLTHAKEAP